MTKARAQGGFTYLMVLFIVAIMGILLAAAGELWQTVQKREKERQLLFVGDQFRKAIEAYYLATPGFVKQYPKKLEDLLEDKRFPTIRRHLRTIYRDPMTGKAEWGQVETGLGISGVYSLSEQAPLKTKNFPAAYESFEGKAKYAEWKFVHQLPSGEQVQPAGPAPGKSIGVMPSALGR